MKGFVHWMARPTTNPIIVALDTSLTFPNWRGAKGELTKNILPRLCRRSSA